MKNFLLKLLTFTFFITLSGELIIRVLKLTPDIPHLYVDQTGIQRYVPGQKGYFSKANEQWEVNNYGWLGVADVKSDSIISIIGDSYIENMMNPISCNQGSILKSYFKDYGFFEAGRSGVTFIEAMQITKLLDSTIKPKMHLIYVAADDFSESNATFRFKDRMQLNLISNTIVNGELKAPGLKKILYNCKVLYYLYLRFPLFVSEKNKESHTEAAKKVKTIDVKSLKSILSYCQKNYDLSKIVLVFHPDTPKEIDSLAREYGFKTIELNTTGDKKSWAVSSVDGHWSCYGHHEVAKQIRAYLATYINRNKSKIALN
ncbi:hypothetical protein AAKU52_001110 [Pedobacter sp. CG_S7]|uniref:hypothetical protein n=1 Tax=Pedobacter sp. CG_S7 TaxID=3143930 RepID=UPI003396CF7F